MQHVNGAHCDLCIALLVATSWLCVGLRTTPAHRRTTRGCCVPGTCVCVQTCTAGKPVAFRWRAMMMMMLMMITRMMLAIIRVMMMMLMMRMMMMIMMMMMLVMLMMMMMMTMMMMMMTTATLSSTGFASACTDVQIPPGKWRIASPGTAGRPGNLSSRAQHSCYRSPSGTFSRSCRPRHRRHGGWPC